MATIDLNNLRPTILGPTPGDLEEARIKRLIDLARLREIQQAPDIQARQLALQEREAGTRETLGFSNLSLEQQKAQVSQFLAEHGVKHDESALAEAGRHNKTTEDLTRSQIGAGLQEHTMALLAQMRPEERQILAEYNAQNGDPTLKNVLATQDAAKKAGVTGDYGPGGATSTTVPPSNARSLGANIDKLIPPIGINKALFSSIPEYLSGAIDNPNHPLRTVLNDFYTGLTQGSTPARTNAIVPRTITPKPVLSSSPYDTFNQRYPQNAAELKNITPGYYDTTSSLLRSRRKRYSSEFPGY